jgi:chitinase
MAYYVPGRDISAESLPLEKLTHIILSFTKVIDNKMSFDNNTYEEKLIGLANQKNNYADLKIMIACGGWGGSGGFSDMASTPQTRGIFIESVISFLTKYNIDGIDIDWEYPGLPGMGNPYKQEDRENFTALMRELRTAMDDTNKRYILTFAAAGWEKYFNYIDLPEVMKYADYINMMTYDLAGGGSPIATHHTNLRKMDLTGTGKPANDFFRNRKTRSAEQVIDYVMEKGVSPEQIVIGCAFYGRTWKGVPPENNGLFQPTKGYWRSAVSYSEIRDKYEDMNGFVRYWDKAAGAPFLYNAADSIFISYDDTASVRLKSEYALKNRLGGIMFWELKHDTEKDGLLDAIFKVSILKQ